MPQGSPPKGYLFIIQRIYQVCWVLSAITLHGSGWGQSSGVALHRTYLERNLLCMLGAQFESISEICLFQTLLSST